jgi:pilus assembly protein Flp/PilA
MDNAFSRFIKNESAISSIEYALLASLIAMIILANISALGTALLGLYTTIQDKIASALA